MLSDWFPPPNPARTRACRSPPPLRAFQRSAGVIVLPWGPEREGIERVLAVPREQRFPRRQQASHLLTFGLWTRTRLVYTSEYLLVVIQHVLGPWDNICAYKMTFHDNNNTYNVIYF